MSRVSIIISFYNKIDVLKLLFVALECQTFKDFEVLVADDGSSSDVVSELKRIIPTLPFVVKHVWHEDLGWRKNKILNLAVAHAESDLLIFMDGDCLPHRSFVEDHLNVAKRGEVSTGRRVMLTDRITKKINADNIRSGILGYKLFFQLLYDTAIKGKITKMEQMIRLKPDWFRHLIVRDSKRFILGCNFSMFKNDLIQIDGFDERFVHPGYGEDIDLGNRLSNNGVKIMSRRRLMVLFHTYHVHLDTEYSSSLALLEENNSKRSCLN